MYSVHSNGMIFLILVKKLLVILIQIRSFFDFSFGPPAVFDDEMTRLGRKVPRYRCGGRQEGTRWCLNVSRSSIG